MLLHSKIRTSFTYETRGSKFTVNPGANPLTEDELTRIRSNSAFKKHLAGGHVAVDRGDEAAPAPVATDLPPPDALDPANDEPPAIDPRAKLPGETKKQHRDRLALLDAAPAPVATDPPAPDHAKLFLEWDGLDEVTREALWPSLTEEEQRAIQLREAGKDAPA